jgi:hypothetical protein
MRRTLRPPRGWPAGVGVGFGVRRGVGVGPLAGAPGARFLAAWPWPLACPTDRTRANLFVRLTGR